VVVIPSHTAVTHAFPPAAHAGRVPCGWPLTGTHVPCAPDASHASHSAAHGGLAGV
jgi:hypothetical protein